MGLNSIAFFAFLLITFIIYWSTPAKLRWEVLLLSGYVFYISWDWRYALLLFSVTLVAYVSGILLERFKSRNKIRKTILNIALLLCLGSLFVFKYFNFFSLSFKNFLARFSINVDSITLKLLLPIGISFYTFQAVGYIIDVYREDFKAEYHFGKFAAFMSFFPQLLSGPIARSESLLPQIKEYHQFDYERATYGIKRIVIGTFKKFVIADYLGGFINPVFATPESYNGFAYLLSIFLFSIQIYCDFAGYSDIAIGLARLFDIDLIENFKTPYFASSIKEFWGRWHISLSTWLRDYVYIPLGGNRVGKLRHSFNLMVTFLISGLWHGSNWTFVVWGGCHGALQIIENILFGKSTKRKKSIVHVIITFILCSFVWTFFKANTVVEAVHMITHCLDGILLPRYYIMTGLVAMNISTITILEIGFFIVLLFIYDLFSVKRDCIEWFSKKPIAIRWMIYIIVVLMIVVLQPEVGGGFIYFQF